MPLSSKPTTLRPGSTDSSHGADLPGVDTTGLRRAVTLLEAGQVGPEAFMSMLRQELGAIESRSDALYVYAQRVSIELRQLREMKEHDVIEQQDAIRLLQDENDQFVEQLIAEHEVEIQSLRRERDAAIDRVRELSRGLSRVGSMSTPSMRRVSTHSLPAMAAGSADASVLRARVDELLFERERSLKLLRQLAEQRDHAEARLHAVLHQSASLKDTEPPREAASLGRIPTVKVATETTPSAGSTGSRSEGELARSTSQTGPVPAVLSRHAVDIKQVDAQQLLHEEADAKGAVPPRDPREGADSAVVRTASSRALQATQTASERGTSDDWDLNPPIATTPSLTPALPAIARAAERAQPNSRTPSSAHLERSSAYTLASEELPVEEVILLRRPIKTQQDR